MGPPDRPGLSRRVAGLLVTFFAALAITACSDGQAAVTRLVEVTRLVTVTPAPAAEAPPVTRLVVVTATPAAQAERQFAAADPAHYRALVEDGPQTLDPALALDPASRQLVQNVVEPLLLPDPWEPDAFLPILATRWLAGADGLRYTFIIRRGVSFSNGNALTPADVAYSLQRALLQATPDSPVTALLEPLLGYRSGDITQEIGNGIYAGDRDALLENASPRQLLAACEQVKEAIVADEAASTVTFSLAQRWAPFPAALSQPWTGIVDREWAIEQGAWDGDCATWAEWYAPEAGDSALATTIMGTGPYILDHWTPGIEYVLLGNEDYWRRTLAPMGPDGPSGPPAIKTVTIRQEPEAHLRWRALRDGQAESADLSPEARLLAHQLVGEICAWPSGECMPGEDSAGPLRQYRDLTLPSHHALFFNFDINAGEGPSFVGSGQLDGDGVPPDFFADAHVRRAFAYCFDEARYVELALNGNGRLDGSLIPAYYGRVANDLPPTYGFQPEACAEELATAWDNLLPQMGFHLQLPFESGDDTQQKAALLLQEGLRAVSADYRVEIVGLARPEYLAALRTNRLPLALLAWTPLLPDPHSWVAPAYAGEAAAFQRLPPPLRSQFEALLEAGASTLEGEARRAIYQTLVREERESVPHLLLPEPTGSHYQQRWVENWFYRPTFAEPYYYAYRLRGY